MNDIIRKITNWYINLSGLKKLVISVIAILILVILVKLLSGVKIRYEIIDYNNYNIDSLLKNSTLCTDRKIFVQSEEVIDKLFDTQNGTYDIQNKKVKVSDYYDYVVFSDYKYKFSKSKFKSNLKDITNAFKEQYGVQSPSELTEGSIIDEIYLYSESYGMYLVKLNVESKDWYIGIKYETDDTFSIFYFE